MSQTQDEEDVGSARTIPGFCDPSKRCTRTGWVLFWRYLKCPCARPAPIKGPKDASVLKMMRLSVPQVEEEEGGGGGVGRANAAPGSSGNPQIRGRTNDAGLDGSAGRPPDDEFAPEDVRKRPDNTVITSKYTPWDFFPRATALQFRRAVNVYFLFQVLLLMLGNFVPNLFEVAYTPWGTLLVLGFVVGVTLVTEFVDDSRRQFADKRENNRPVVMVDSETGKKRWATWGSLEPGDIVVLKNRELVPADVIVLQTNRNNGMLYIETSGIDGETNLKIKTVGKEMLHHVEEVLGGGETWRKDFAGELKYEEPNPFLSFSGTFYPRPDKYSTTVIPNGIPLGFESLVLRGSEIRNTKWVIAMCAYCGHETKLVLSKKQTPSKFATLDVLINRIIFFAIAQSLIFTIVSVCVLFLATPNTGSLWYFKNSDTFNSYLLPGPLAFLLTFINFFSNCVPIDLYVTIEFANVYQAFVFMRDLEMYDSVTDTAASTKTTNLISEIGQVSHVFSDKTGTLTQNVMRLVGLALPNGGGRFGVKVADAQPSGVDFDSSPSSPAADTMLGKRVINQRQVFGEFMTMLEQSNDDDCSAVCKAATECAFALALCHSVVVDLDEEGLPRYNAEGPDEEAIIKACAVLGFVLKATENSTYTISALGETLNFKVLALNAFTSDRKRMSILLQKLDGKDASSYTLYLKGADNVVADLAALGTMNDRLAEDLNAFAQHGLRTLLVAKRDMSLEQVTACLKEYEAARVLVGNDRETALSHFAASIECDLQILGATAIEDALQEGVPETVQMLRDASIKVWVLTGDKVDTAINIGFSSRLLDPSMHRILLDDAKIAEQMMDEALVALNEAAERVEGKSSKNLSQQRAKEEGSIDGGGGDDAAQVDWTTKSLALIVTGKTLESLLSRQRGNELAEEKFITLSKLCAVVLACRVSPSQKALIVRAVSDGAQKITGESSNNNGLLKRFRTNRKRRAPVTLAIGDGANDVAMIQQAKVGVGISGKEGMQAVNSADFSIAQFRYLQRLLFVHGRWNYRRNAVLFRYVCYSWQVLNWALFFYLFVSMFSGTQVYVVTYYVTAFAWLCNFVIVGIAWFDRDISPATALANPSSYDLGRLNIMLKPKVIIVDVFLCSLAHAAIMYYVIASTLSVDLDQFGSTMFMALVALCTAIQCMLALTWTWILILALWAVIVGYFIIVSIIDLYISGAGVALVFTFEWPSAYQLSFFVVFTVVSLDYAVFGLRRTIIPTPTEILMEQDRGYANATTRPVMHGVLDAFEAVREGADRVFVLPAKEVYEFIKKTGVKKEEATATPAAAEADPTKPKRSAFSKLITRSGYVDSSPQVDR